MRDYLVFRLYGQMTSWGDIAVGEHRPTFDRPSKSSIMGLIAAALGILRDEDKKHRKLAEAYNLAIQVNASGILLRDYHTTQVPPSGSGRNKKIFYTRKDELETPKENLKTILSTRDYRCDALYSVCLWCRTDKVPYPLETLAQTLKEPIFMPYLGRKSCPLSLPMQPKIVSGSSPEDVFIRVNFDEGLLRGLPRDDEPRLYWEGDDQGMQAEHTITRRDEPLSRKRWQFADRTEHYKIMQKSRGE